MMLELFETHVFLKLKKKTEKKNYHNVVQGSQNDVVFLVFPRNRINFVAQFDVEADEIDCTALHYQNMKR